MEDILQFYRTYKLVIGSPETNKGIVITGDDAKDSGLQMKFGIKKHIDNSEKANEASIELFNLSEESINYIQKPDIAIFLYVGYNNNNKLLFQGIIKEVDTEDRASRRDRRTTLRCTPADSLVYQPSISKTFPANTSPREIVNYIVGQSPTLSKASFNSSNIDDKFPFGYSVSGTPKEILDDLARDYNLFYRIDGRRLYISDPNRYQSPNSTERAFVISPSTGLLGVPVYASPDGKTNKDDTQRKDGIKFTALCNALIIPGSAISIKDTVINGIVRVNSCEYKGDWRGNTWQVTCWCSKLSGQEV